MLVGIDASRATRAHRTGTENYSLHILRGLLGSPRPCDFRLYLREPLPDGLIPGAERADRRVIRLPRLWTQVGLSRAMLDDAPDVLYVPSHVLPLVLPKGSVSVVHDVGHRFFPRAHKPLEWLYVELTTRRHVRTASQLLTLSEASRQDIIRLYGADPARIHVAYPAADESFHPASDAEIADVRGKYGLPQRFILHIGTIKPRKNLPRLVDAFGRANLPDDVVLVLGGKTTSGGRALGRAIEDSPVAQRIRVLPYVAYEDLRALYSGALLVALVSLHEGFGVPALEALACGAPVVVTNTGSLPEVVGDTGILVDPLDVASIARGIERVVGDPGLLRDLRERGPGRAATFAWSAAADVTFAAIQTAARA